MKMGGKYVSEHLTKKKSLSKAFQRKVKVYKKIKNMFLIIAHLFTGSLEKTLHIEKKKTENQCITKNQFFSDSERL